jgi:hypothetical protein
MAVLSMAVYTAFLGYANTIPWLGMLATNYCRWDAFPVA